MKIIVCCWLWEISGLVCSVLFVTISEKKFLFYFIATACNYIGNIFNEIQVLKKIRTNHKSCNMLFYFIKTLSKYTEYNNDLAEQIKVKRGKRKKNVFITFLKKQVFESNIMYDMIIYVLIIKICTTNTKIAKISIVFFVFGKK